MLLPRFRKMSGLPQGSIGPARQWQGHCLWLEQAVHFRGHRARGVTGLREERVSSGKSGPG